MVDVINAQQKQINSLGKRLDIKDAEKIWRRAIDGMAERERKDLEMKERSK